MEFIKTSRLSLLQKQEVCCLWNSEYPQKLNVQTFAQFENYLGSLKQRSYIIMVDENQTIKGWYVEFYRNDQLWFAIILDAEFQGKGLGRSLLELAKENKTQLNGWVIDHNNDKKRNGEMYRSPLNFYLKNGFELNSETRLEDDKISAVKIKWKR